MGEFTVEDVTIFYVDEPVRDSRGVLVDLKPRATSLAVDIDAPPLRGPADFDPDEVAEELTARLLGGLEALMRQAPRPRKQKRTAKTRKPARRGKATQSARSRAHQRKVEKERAARRAKRRAAQGSPRNKQGRKGTGMKEFEKFKQMILGDPRDVGPDMRQVMERMRRMAMEFGVPERVVARSRIVRDDTSRRYYMELDGAPPIEFDDQLTNMRWSNGGMARALEAENPKTRAERRITELETALKASVAQIKQQDEFLQRLTAKPQLVARVYALADDTGLMVLQGNQLIRVERDKDFAPAAGSPVLLCSETGQVLGPYLGAATSGPTGTVTAVRVEQGIAEVDVGGENRSCRWSPSSLPLEAGDRVCLDDTRTMVLERLGRAGSQQVLTTEVTVTWDDVGGQEEAKQALREAVELPLAHPELWRGYSLPPARGCLLHGPPGCGKTMLAKALASAVAATAGGRAGGYIYVKGAELLSMWVGATEASIRGLFARARAWKAETGAPAVIFLDEADALLSRRGSGVSSDMEKTIIPTFLAEMDGLEESGAYVLLATNRPERLDPAVVRPGRIDRKVLVGRPDEASAEAILMLHLRSRPIAGDGVAQRLASHATRTIFAGPLREQVSGALCAAVVEQAVMSALRRDLSLGRKLAGGIAQEDVDAALAALVRGDEGARSDHVGAQPIEVASGSGDLHLHVHADHVGVVPMPVGVAGGDSKPDGDPEVN